MPTVLWKNEPDDHDYPAAAHYLTLLLPNEVSTFLERIADGYHRECASYHIDEDTDIPCRITDLG